MEVNDYKSSCLFWSDLYKEGKNIAGISILFAPCMALIYSAWVVGGRGWNIAGLNLTSVSKKDLRRGPNSRAAVYSGVICRWNKTSDWHKKSLCDKELKTSLVKTVRVKGTGPADLLIHLTQRHFKMIFKVFPLPYFYAA